MASQNSDHQHWLRDEQTDLAVERILDAAGTVFVQRGIAGTGMADIARAASCSRATLYRYFDNRAALRQAYVNREARRVAAAVGRATAAIADPRERLVEVVLTSVDLVRSTPTLAAWFSSSDMGIASQLSTSSEVIAALANGAPGGVDDRPAAQWIVRSIVSILTMPGGSAIEERSLVETFMVPPLLAPGRVRPRR